MIASTSYAKLVFTNHSVRSNIKYYAPGGDVLKTAIIVKSK